MRGTPVTHVCIIGGGPAGLAAAIAVSQLGYRATIVDHALPPVDKACGEGLLPDSIAVLKRLGIQVPGELGFRLRGIRFLNAHSSVAADFPNGSGVGMRRIALHRLLLRRVQELGVVCHWGAKNIRFARPKVTVDGHTVESDLIVAADGQNSLTRRSCGLHKIVRERKRYAFRRHYRVTPWSSYVELHWGSECQMYVTPVADDEVCIVSMSRDPRIRFDDALRRFPTLRERLAGAEPVSRDMGALSVCRKLRRIWQPDIALLGDASGSVDAITGEGLNLAFRQALCLADALCSGNLDDYQSKHTLLSRRPQVMGTLMLTLDKHLGFQRRALAGLASCPELFAGLLAVHVGEQSFSDLLSWQLVHFFRAFLEA